MNTFKKNLPFIIIMSLFVIACAAITAFTINNEPKYIVVTPHETKTAATVESPQLININTATSEELQNLPGIGESIAGRIIAYREEHGGFLFIDEIMEVSGIGEKIFDSIRKYITISG